MKIIPVEELKNTEKISRLCHQSNEPVFLTKGGYGDMVIMSMQTYEEMSEQLDNDEGSSFDLPEDVQPLYSADDNAVIIKKVMLAAIERGAISTAWVQRTFSVGYVRAMNIMDALESRGYITAADGIAPRKITVTKEEFLHNCEK